MDALEFQRATDPFRRALQAHCYRMMGSLSEAEDLLQETLLRAWRGMDAFEGRSSLRSWLYRIATNTCLDALERRPARTLPTLRSRPLGPGEQPGPPLAESIWVEPYPDEQMPGPGEEVCSPDVCISSRESVALAFLAALQLLPPRQRAVLLLRDVLGWQANETAELLETSVAGVNSALQRARATLEEHRPSEPTRPPQDEELRTLLVRYLRAWEDADVGALVALLKEDAAFTMPPLEAWVLGRPAIGGFLSMAVLPASAAGLYRLVETAANGGPALAFYKRGEDGVHRAQGIQVLSMDGGQIAMVTSYLDPRWPTRFGLPAQI